MTRIAYQAICPWLSVEEFTADPANARIRTHQFHPWFSEEENLKRFCQILESEWSYRDSHGQPIIGFEVMERSDTEIKLRLWTDFDRRWEEVELA